MIQLDSDRLFLSDGEGGEIPADPAQLRLQLNSAFETCDIQKSWLADSLADTVTEKIRLACRRGEALTQEDVNRLLGNVLKVSGLGDVADAFIRITSGSPAVSASSPESLTTPARLRMPVTTRYINADQWQPDLPPECSLFLERRLLRVMPASDLLPVAVVLCRPALLHDFSTPPDASGTMADQLALLCRAIVPVLAAMKSRIRREWPDAREPQALIRFAGMDAFLQLSASGSTRRRALTRLRRQAAEIIRAQVDSCSDFTISISYS